MIVRRLWAASGALAVLLFGCGLLFGDVLGWCEGGARTVASRAAIVEH